MRKALLALTACAFTHACHALIIDDFTDGITGGELTTAPGSGTDTAIDAAPTGVLFDTREWFLFEPVGTTGLAESSLDVNTTIGVLTFSNDPDVTESAFEISYTSLGEDLTDGGLNAVFELDVFFSDVTPPDFATLTISVVDGDFDPPDTASVDFDVAGTVSIAFADFAPTTDFTDITFVSVLVEAVGVDAPDILFDEFRTNVPEPATYAAIFGGLALALGIARRRRNVR